MNRTPRPRTSSAVSAVGSLALAIGVATGGVVATARPAHGNPPAATSIQTTAHAGAFVASRNESYVAAHPSRYVRSMVANVNRERARRGLPRYRYNRQLSAVALRWARTMRATQTLQHNLRLGRQVTNYRWVGENVGYGPSVAVTHRAFMNSPAHRANVLDRDYTQVGMAVVKDGNGRFWITEVFRAPW